MNGAAAVAELLPEERPVVAIVAAKNSAATVGDTVRALVALPAVDEVIVVDDGSTDDTTAQARQAGAWVLRLPENRGKGGAVAAGVALASHAGTYLLVDADVGATAAAAEALLIPVVAGRADMTVGVLPSAGRKGGFGLVRNLAAAGIRRATGIAVTAPLSGQRAARGELLRSLALAPRFGLETALTIDARRAGARVVEVPVAMDHRHTGRSIKGFAHRARQGADIGRALWPRVTTSSTRVRVISAAAVLAVVAALWSGGQWEASSVPLAQQASKVLIVGMPGLTWDEVGTGRLPNLDRLITQGALAAMTVRTLSHDPAPTEAYATLGAGARVTAGTIAEDATGAGGSVVVPAASAIRRDAGAYVASKPGALGDALHAAGLRTGVVGNADTPSGLVGLEGVEATRRPVAVALMDHAGLVDAGSVDPADLLMKDGTAAFGERANPDRVLARTGEALAAADVVLVDPGDLDRAASLEGVAPEAYRAQFRDRALGWTDALLGRLVAQAPPGTLIMVACTVPPGEEWRLTPVVASGPGVTHGYLHSPSTRRLGLVTLTDLAPTILAALGAPVPTDMIGHALRYHAGTPDPTRLGRLDRDIAYRERIYLSVALGFIALQAVVYLVIAGVIAGGVAGPVAGGVAGVIAGAVSGRSGRRRRRWAPLLRDVALGIAAFPLGTLLYRGLVPFAPSLGGAGALLLPILIVAIVLVARRARGGNSPLAPLAWVFGATVWLLLADVATGGRLQVGGLLGYSPQSAGRFFGLGNTTFAVLAACTLLVAAIHLERAPRRREALAAVAALFVLVILIDGAPSLGDDVGGILTLVPVLGVTLVAFWGRRLTWRRMVGVVGIAVLVLGAATTVDLLRPPDARTHLGRVAADSWHNGGGELLTTIARKAEANVRLLRLTPWSWAVPIIAAFLLYVLVVRRGWADLLPPGSPLRLGVVGAVAAGVLGFAVNDSGVVVTALALVEVGPLLATLALAGDPGQPVLLEPGPDAAALAVHPPGLRGPSPVDGPTPSRRP